MNSRRSAPGRMLGGWLLAAVIACNGGDPTRDSIDAAGDDPEAPGTRHQVRVENLPPPFETPSVYNDPVIRRGAGRGSLSVPAGLRAELWAERLAGPRRALVLDNGDVLVSESFGLRVALLRDTDGDSRPDARFLLLDTGQRPYGLAWNDGWLYVGVEHQVVRVPFAVGATAVSGPVEVVTTLSGGGHWTRDVLFSADGSRLFVSVGSRSNINLRDNEPTRRALVLEMDPDGSDERVFASGLRNPVSLQHHPKTGALWASVNERDGMGDDLPPDFVTAVADGGFYGWPYAYVGPNPDPHKGDERPDLVARTVVPDVLLAAHSAPMGIHFYRGEGLATIDRGDLLVALHGSANRSRRTGYKVVRVPMDHEGRPARHYEDVVTGWSDDPDGREVWGRPVGLAELADGSLLVLDDGAGRIWRLHAAAAES